jgi:2-amino-4-hydroxy-6-hydroxymethyldihydropteridine diphosphokinase
MIEDERLVVPHIGLHEREFVVYPLMEIAGDITIPGKDSLKAIAAKCPRGALEKLEQL